MLTEKQSKIKKPAETLSIQVQGKLDHIFLLSVATCDYSFPILDEQVLEAIFNPENLVTDLEVSGRTDNQLVPRLV